MGKAGRFTLVNVLELFFCESEGRFVFSTRSFSCGMEDVAAPRRRAALSVLRSAFLRR